MEKVMDKKQIEEIKNAVGEFEEIANLILTDLIPEAYPNGRDKPASDPELAKLVMQMEALKAIGDIEVDQDGSQGGRAQANWQAYYDQSGPRPKINPEMVPTIGNDNPKIDNNQYKKIFKRTDGVEDFFEIDEEHRLWRAETKLFFGKTKVVYPYSEIRGVQVINMLRKKGQANLYNASIGGALMGPEGAFVGALIGGDKKIVCNRLTVSIDLNKLVPGAINISLLDGDIPTSEPVYQMGLEVAKKIEEMINVKILGFEPEYSELAEDYDGDYEGDDDSQEMASVAGIKNQEVMSISDEIKKAKELLDAHAITQEEYEKIKKKLI